MNIALCAALASFMALAIDAAQGQTYSVLHGFAGPGAGPNTAGSANPNGPLTLLNGNLYGVTRYGGAYDPGNPIGQGTVYSINASSGAGDLIYTFVNSQNTCLHPNGVNQTDGVEPFTGLTPYTSTGGGTVLYGTTYHGGDAANGTGVIFLD